MRFAVSRIARIYPAYLLSLVLVSWFALQFALRPGQTLAHKVAVLADYAFLLQGWTGPLSVGWNTPAWSLSCELFFYLCFPVFFLLLRRGRVSAIFSALAVSFIAPILLARAGVPSSWKPLHHLSDFLAGIAAAGVYNRLRGRRRDSIFPGYWLYIPALLAGAAFIMHPRLLEGSLMNLNTVLRPLNVVLLIGLAAGGGFGARALSNRTIGYFGKASYSMYILHIPLLWWYSRYTLYHFGPTPPAWVGFVFVAAVMAFALAAFELVETPANRWIREWSALRIPYSRPSKLRVAA